MQRVHRSMDLHGSTIDQVDPASREVLVVAAVVRGATPVAQRNSEKTVDTPQRLVLPKDRIRDGERASAPPIEVKPTGLEVVVAPPAVRTGLGIGGRIPDGFHATR